MVIPNYLDQLCLVQNVNPGRSRLSSARSRLGSHSAALEVVFDNTQVRLKPFLISLKCVRRRLRSDSNALDSLHALELRSNLPIIRHKCDGIRL